MLHEFNASFLLSYLTYKIYDITGLYIVPVQHKICRTQELFSNDNYDLSSAEEDGIPSDTSVYELTLMVFDN